jgi:hypothetical protein
LKKMSSFDERPNFINLDLMSLRLDLILSHIDLIILNQT